MSVGLPVLTTACGGPEDIVDGADLGMVVPVSVEGLADGLVGMVDRLGSFDAATIRARARARFDFGVVVGEVAGLYRTALAGGPTTEREV
jgi:glycosyltransferase involved in cell wall biosynthesis